MSPSIVKDRYPVYLDWERFEQVQAMLRDNHAEYQRNKTRGVPRDGAAVLQGIVWCGQCGHKMAVQYKNANSYACNYLLRSQGAQLCQHLPADLIDARVVEAFLAAIGPAELEAWARAKHARQQTRDATNRAEAQQVERRRYQALLAERQYNRVDPDNRLIAAEFERRWETALRELRQAENALAHRQAQACKPEALSAEEQSDFLALGARLPEIWQRPQVNRESKKALPRSLIDKMILQRVTRDRITIRVVWRGGEISQLEVEPRVHAGLALSRGAEMEARVLELARHGIDDVTIAGILTQEGHHSARCSHVPARTVQLIRQRHRVLHDARSIRERHIAGWLTIARVAQCLQVSTSWVKRRIHTGVINVQRDPQSRQHRIPRKASLHSRNSNRACETISSSPREQTDEGINMTYRRRRLRPKSKFVSARRVQASDANPHCFAPAGTPPTEYDAGVADRNLGH
ncbi:recombinase-like zinc beta ribbon protein [Paraburkholderia sp. BL23I1N1]|uniref:zinc ribbon domain-containing protein n=1 Tax=unclassified Paraburkholderia TaxID=2615204 RepID=UPI000E380123|nr:MULTISPECIES: zinc ribbon domain-containing protein [unclassified Paraburkholderia]REE18557.1 recombinase-like zinc beta ribbon protein [Paraburkholderia sp. BL27I4N3]RKE35570.1 recombinase-like zinc beta ribbon protein [Paraburkholderia sp. BL23I1N1]